MSTSSKRSSVRIASRPPAVYALLLGYLVLAVTALYGGVALVVAPDASLVDAVIAVDLSHLADTPFTDYAIPGLILLVVLGIYPLAVAYAVLAHWSWAWAGVLSVGVLLIGWIGVEVLLIGYVSVLQSLYAVFGIALTAAPFLPSVREDLQSRNGGEP